MNSKSNCNFTSSTGEVPGKGTYECCACGQKVNLDDSTDKLPPCPSCSATEYSKL